MNASLDQMSVANPNDRTENKAISLLVVIDSLMTGGSERHVSLVLPRLKALGYRPTVYSLGPLGPPADALERSGIPVIDGWRGVAWIARMPRPLRGAAIYAALVARLNR